MLMENDEAASGLNNMETELTLGLPGESRQKLGAKRGFYETVGLSLGRFNIHEESRELLQKKEVQNEIFVSHVIANSANAKNQVVGWPPVRSFRQNIVNKPKKFVKVAVDGAPFLRKVDLENYNSYKQLLCALGEMFTCFTIRNGLVIDPVSGFEYVTTYEDKDGDWMLVGDVPWKMFVESCKRVRLMKSSEAIGLASKTPTNCSSSSTR